ncbi:hypothetical protein O181_032897 [Austropuccinia psidii MF-1]|uniref:Uncharacterized protein n=1 Tax=Austropuccinia psidii MF-1 TaxID=1389203 RepID=A0A9Q3H6N4_9BASI|nr:hypothetical protein [Austropuccinia psidii MF-1]
MRQQRNKALKAYNVVEHGSQKEHQRWLKEELPDNVHRMRSAAHSHCLFLLKEKDKDFSSLPAPPRTKEHEIAIQVDCHLGCVPKDMRNHHRCSLRASKDTANMSSTS